MSAFNQKMNVSSNQTSKSISDIRVTTHTPTLKKKHLVFFDKYLPRSSIKMKRTYFKTGPLDKDVIDRTL